MGFGRKAAAPVGDAPDVTAIMAELDDMADNFLADASDKLMDEDFGKLCGSFQAVRDGFNKGMIATQTHAQAS